jgi:hypothetical protein
LSSGVHRWVCPRRLDHPHQRHYIAPHNHQDQDHNLSSRLLPHNRLRKKLRLLLYYQRMLKYNALYIDYSDEMTVIQSQDPY